MLTLIAIVCVAAVLCIAADWRLRLFRLDLMDEVQTMIRRK